MRAKTPLQLDRRQVVESLRNFVAAAGIPAPRVSPQAAYTDDELLREYAQVCRELGRTPSVSPNCIHNLFCGLCALLFKPAGLTGHDLLPSFPSSSLGTHSPRSSAS